MGRRRRAHARYVIPRRRRHMLGHNAPVCPILLVRIDSFEINLMKPSPSFTQGHHRHPRIILSPRLHPLRPLRRRRLGSSLPSHHLKGSLLRRLEARISRPIANVGQRGREDCAYWRCGASLLTVSAEDILCVVLL